MLEDDWDWSAEVNQVKFIKPDRKVHTRSWRLPFHKYCLIGGYFGKTPLHEKIRAGCVLGDRHVFLKLKERVDEGPGISRLRGIRLFRISFLQTENEGASAAVIREKDFYGIGLSRMDLDPGTITHGSPVRIQGLIAMEKVLWESVLE